nr:MAG TPA_asm: hypothetical protein [Caudoviricetes sp.]
MHSQSINATSEERGQFMTALFIFFTQSNPIHLIQPIRY